MVDTSGPVIDEGAAGYRRAHRARPSTQRAASSSGRSPMAQRGPELDRGRDPAPDMLRVFAEGAAAVAEQGSAVTRLLPGSRARIARTQVVAPSSVADEMGRLKVAVSVSGNPRPEQLSALRDALTGGRPA